QRSRLPAAPRVRRAARVRRPRARAHQRAAGARRAGARGAGSGHRRAQRGGSGAAAGGAGVMSTTATPLVQGGGALQAQGMALLAALHATAQALRLYPLENATVQKALDELSLV